MKEKIFTKDELLKSKRFKYNKDILNAILKDNRHYSIDDVEKLIRNFLKKEVK